MDRERVPIVQEGRVPTVVHHAGPRYLPSATILDSLETQLVSVREELDTLDESGQPEHPMVPATPESVSGASEVEPPAVTDVDKILNAPMFPLDDALDEVAPTLLAVQQPSVDALSQGADPGDHEETEAGRVDVSQEPGCLSTRQPAASSSSTLRAEHRQDHSRSSKSKERSVQEIRGCRGDSRGCKGSSSSDKPSSGSSGCRVSSTSSYTHSSRGSSSSSSGSRESSSSASSSRGSCDSSGHRYGGSSPRGRSSTSRSGRYDGSSSGSSGGTRYSSSRASYGGSSSSSSGAPSRDERRGGSGPDAHRRRELDKVFDLPLRSDTKSSGSVHDSARFTDADRRTVDEMTRVYAEQLDNGSLDAVRQLGLIGEVTDRFLGGVRNIPDPVFPPSSDQPKPPLPPCVAKRFKVLQLIRRAMCVVFPLTTAAKLVPPMSAQQHFNSTSSAQRDVYAVMINQLRLLFDVRHDVYGRNKPPRAQLDKTRELCVMFRHCGVAAITNVLEALWASSMDYGACNEAFARMEASYVGMVDAVTTLLNRYMGVFPEPDLKLMAAEVSGGLPDYLVRRWTLSHISCATPEDRIARNKAVMKAVGFMHAARADMADMLVSMANSHFDVFDDNRGVTDVDVTRSRALGACLHHTLAAYWSVKKSVMDHVHENAPLQQPLTYSLRSLSGVFVDGVTADEQAWIAHTVDNIVTVGNLQRGDDVSNPCSPTVRMKTFLSNVMHDAQLLGRIAHKLETVSRAGDSCATGEQF